MPLWEMPLFLSKHARPGREMLTRDPDPDPVALRWNQVVVQKWAELVDKIYLGLSPPSNSHHQDYSIFSRESL